MQAVILAAGRGTRMGKLTENLPKPMLEVAGKSLLEHKFDALPEEVDEIIIVTGYLGEKIREKFGDSYNGKKITYVEQPNITGGTLDALIQARPFLHDRFFVLYGDDIYRAQALKDCLPCEWAVVVKKSDNLASAASVVVENGFVREILEKEEHDGGAGYANTGLYLLDMRIFEYAPVVKDAHSSEIGLPQTMATAANDIRIAAVETDEWFVITAPEDIERAEKEMKERKN
ncbi:MAG: sugar phosphate nucleotidyltransferase [Minisyncoccia bacterium]